MNDLYDKIPLVILYGENPNLVSITNLIIFSIDITNGEYNKISYRN